MSLTASNYSVSPLYFAYRRTSTNDEHTETFHSHLGLEVLYIHQGKGTMIVNNNRYGIKPGMLCIFQPCQLHHLKLEYDDGGCFERSIAIFEPTMYETYFEQWPGLHDFYRSLYLGELPVPCIYEVDDPLLEEIFRSMHGRYMALSEKDQAEEVSLFLITLFRTLRLLWDKHDVPSAGYQTHRRKHRIEHILDWIEMNYMRPFRLDDMATDLRLSPYYLSHLFKEATGVSITEYIATRRIHQAIQLLTTTDKPVSLIAEEIGLTNISYFCRLFRSHMNTTPHQYRKIWTNTLRLR